MQAGITAMEERQTTCFLRGFKGHISLFFINSCLASGSLQTALKHALVRQKKPILTPPCFLNSDLSPICPFFKVLEKVVFI